MDLIEFLSNTDQAITVFFNSLHLPFLDFLMEWISFRFTWIPFYILLFYVLYKKFGRKSILILLFCIALITVSDQTANLLKNGIQRFRPCHNLNLSNTIHLVGNCGGQYGFVSGHAANSFALAVFIVLINRNRIKKLNTILILYAILVSYSRVYNGVHYLGDIICGCILGSLTAYLFSIIYTFTEKKLHKIN